MFARQIRQAGLAIAALALATSFNLTPAAAAATTSVYGIEPATPTVPSVPGPSLDTRADIEVKYLSVEKQNSTYTWTFRVKNIAAFPASDVKVRQDIRRSTGAPNSEYEHNFSYPVAPGNMAPGEVKYYTVSCAPKAGHPPCFSAALEAYMGAGSNHDHNPANNQANHGTAP